MVWELSVITQLTNPTLTLLNFMLPCSAHTGQSNYSVANKNLIKAAVNVLLLASALDRNQLNVNAQDVTCFFFFPPWVPLGPPFGFLVFPPSQYECGWWGHGYFLPVVIVSFVSSHPLRQNQNYSPHCPFNLRPVFSCSLADGCQLASSPNSQSASPFTTV